LFLPSAMKIKLVTPADGLRQMMQGFRRFLYGLLTVAGVVAVVGCWSVRLMVLPSLFEEVFVSEVVADLYEAVFLAEVEDAV
jgi:hypothetical protein